MWGLVVAEFSLLIFSFFLLSLFFFFCKPQPAESGAEEPGL